MTGGLNERTCKAEAIVIERREWSEASQIVTLLSDRFGRLKALAKGARRPKSRHGGGVDLLDRVAIVFYPRDRGMHLLSETVVLPDQPARRLRTRLATLLAGFTVAETLRDALQEQEPDAGVYALTCDVLRALGSSDRPAEVLTAFEWHLLHRIGFGPRLDECAGCEQTIPPGAAPFAPAFGGTLCRSCLPAAQGPIRTLPAPVRDFLRMLNPATSPTDAARPTRLVVRDARTALADVWRGITDRARRTDRYARLIDSAGESESAA
jgi:DNA repair protein RecO (recombination protein O)